MQGTVAEGAPMRLDNVHVAAAHRRQGLGRLLLETCTQWCRLHGWASLELSVFTDNAPALALYARFGGHITDTRTITLPDGSHADVGTVAWSTT